MNRDQEPRGFSGAALTAGLFGGALVLTAVYIVLLVGHDPVSQGGAGLGPSLLPLVLYLLAASALTWNEGSRSFGVGLLISVGLWLLFGGGICIAGLSRTPSNAAAFASPTGGTA
ncbi:hypothetical protein [Sinomonas atrocyanea]|uniref:hypothetical protein n=1 Tax=Sinomonas atrocyanea TaxID=37927 RepID=UPI003D99B249